MKQAEIAYKEHLEETQDRDQLILKELPQVYYIARRIYERLPQHVPFEDLVHAGVIGLIEAIRSYDAKKSVPLKAFAKFRIRGAILDSLRELDWGSRPLRRKGRQIEEAIAKLSAKLGRQPEDSEVAAELGTSIEDLYETATRLDGLVLIGQEVNPAYDRSEKQDLIETAPSRDESPYDLCLRSEVKDQLAQAIETLSEKEQMVISLYYKEELTMKEIAAVLQLGESRVSQIHAMALPKIRAALRKASFDESNV
jgi:RNA polymerase sigma factor for flagellar operon FliA